MNKTKIAILDPLTFAKAQESKVRAATGELRAACEASDQAISKREAVLVELRSVQLPPAPRLALHLPSFLLGCGVMGAIAAGVAFL